MNRMLRVALPALLAALVATLPARAQDPGMTLVDRGRLIVFHGKNPVGTERFLFEQDADTLVVIAHASRRLAGEGGKPVDYTKNMALVARAADMGMLHYNSSEKYGDRAIAIDVAPNDTMLVISIESDSKGASNWLERPPGRFFALDPGIYTLFDVFVRGLQGRLFGPRPASLVIMGEDARTSEGTVAPAGLDTVSWGGKRVVTQRMTLTDSTGVLDLWVSPEGRLLRLEDPAQGISVMREPPAPPPAAVKRRKPAAR